MYNAQAIDASFKVSSTLVLLNIAQCHTWNFFPLFIVSSVENSVLEKYNLSSFLLGKKRFR